MTEINELAALGAGPEHPADDTNCPFCPVENKEETWTTYGGNHDESKSDILRVLLVTPGQLIKEQPLARPKPRSGGPARQAMEDAAEIPASPEGPEGRYSFEAHHLISGNHALRDNPAKWWLIKGDSIEADTGYSVNNATNGIWLPSVPTRWVKGGFGACTDQQKYDIACVPMRAGLGQFHKGAHHIIDADDAGQKHHGSYNTWLNDRLDSVSGRIGEWSRYCAVSKKRKKPQKLRPSVRVHDVFDNVSRTMRRMVSGPGENWTVFVSKLALWYHKELTNDNPLYRMKYPKKAM